MGDCKAVDAVVISIHALLAESDGAKPVGSLGYFYFYPRSPCGERQDRGGFYPRHCVDFYPRSPCGERLCLFLTLYRIIYISIHALLAESDFSIYAVMPHILISIHALLAESDFLRPERFRYLSISIHALLAESDPRTTRSEAIGDISIHALLAESDSPFSYR